MLSYLKQKIRMIRKGT